ncbi:MAG TPA: DNA alkylation repair protein [Candidatus Acidoferrales bacterium]|nr:DNA alkylation repair protein [Candidatus Acidoferrales bacterium]
MTLAKARKALRRCADSKRARTFRGFFKDTTDIFLGVTTPQMRKVAREFQGLPLRDVRDLMKSKIHEERSLAHAILVLKFRGADERKKGAIFHFYMRNRKYIHEWDGVDDSAPYIAGPYLLRRDKKPIYELARSKSLWDRRIAMVSTWWFIRQGQVHDALKIARLLLKDEEDLIHKASGWMLREAGKRNLQALEKFLKKHHREMPRTMLRYAIERFPQEKRRAYLAGKIN